MEDVPQNIKDQLDGQARRQAAIKKLYKLSKEEQYNLLEKAKKITYDEAMKTHDIEEYLMMCELSNEAARRQIMQMGSDPRLLNDLKMHIYKKWVDQTITLYEFSFYDLFLQEFGWENPYAKEGKRV